MVILYSFQGFEVFLRVPVIAIILFGENNVLGRIYTEYINLGWHLSFIIYKGEKITRTYPILKSNSASF